MLHSAASVIGANLFLLFGETALHIHWMKANCHWNYPMLKIINPARKERGHWQMCLNGLQETWRRIRCLDMPVHHGTSYATWIRITIMNSVTKKRVITGTRWMYMLVEQNMQSVIYYIAGCGQNS